MSENGAMTKLYIFVLVLNLVFPVFGYTFTAFGENPGDYEMDLDLDALHMAGITLVDAESHNMTYNSGWVYFTELNKTIRSQFMDNVRDPMILILGDGVTFQSQSAVAMALEGWTMPYRMSVKSVITNEWIKYIANDTIVRDYNTLYNWSRFILKSGHQVFITPNLTHGNMSRAVYEDAHINVTIAKTFEEESNFNFRRFLGWYTSIMIGSQSWGLPSVFSWVLRILGALSIFAMVMLTKDLIRL